MTKQQNKMKSNIVNQRKHHYKSNKVDAARITIDLHENQITSIDKRPKMIIVNTEGKDKEMVWENLNDKKTKAVQQKDNLCHWS